MIGSFGNKLAQDLFNDLNSSELRRFPPELHRAARRKLFYLHEADQLMDLKVPPGNRLEALKGDLKNFYSIRVNDQWRIIFKWSTGQVFEVSVLDYHN